MTKVVNVRTPPADPAATDKMFKELKKRKLWTIYGPQGRLNLIPTRKRRRANK